MADIPPLVDLAREARRVADLADALQINRDADRDETAAVCSARLKTELAHLIAVAQRALEDL